MSPDSCAVSECGHLVGKGSGTKNSGAGGAEVEDVKGGGVGGVGLGLLRHSCRANSLEMGEGGQYSVGDGAYGCDCETKETGLEHSHGGGGL